MITRLSKKIASFFVYQKIIDKEAEEVYEYGLQLLLSTVANTLIALVVAISTNTFIPCLFYLTTFVLMRKCAGGFHAKTHFNCCCILLAVLCAFIICIKHIPPMAFIPISALSLIFSFIVIYLFAPLEHINKPISIEDKNRLKNLSRLYMVIISFIILLFSIFNLHTLMVSISLGIFTSSMSILVAKLQEKLSNLHFVPKK